MSLKVIYLSVVDKILTYRVGQKTRLFLRVDNFVTVSDRNVCDVSKVFRFRLEKKCKTWMSMKLNILCLVCINIQCTLNYAEFDAKS